MFSSIILVILSFTVNVLSAPHNVTVVNEFGDEKIVGGRLVKIEDFPYQVAIFDSYGFWCGGSIVSAYYVLTAAHCNYNGALPAIIRAGSSYFDVGGSLHHAVEYISLGQYSNTDVGLMRIKEPFIFDKTRQPIGLATVIPIPGTIGVVTGWGDTNQGFLKNRSKQLVALEVPMVSHDLCNKVYQSTKLGTIREGQICAGYIDEGGKDTCNGDDGSPLVVNGVQVGIASMGYGCARKGYPSIYADVSRYVHWIKKHIKQ